MDDVEIPGWLKALPLAPEYRPTETEFSDPVAFISRIEQEASSFGICKVIPPLPKPSKRFVFANLARSLSSSPDCPPVFTTRSQELGSRKGRGSVHKQVWQSGEFYSLEQFEAKARSFARSQLGNCKDVEPMQVEAMFWKAAEEKPIYIEYANDVPGSGFSVPEEPIKGCMRWQRRKQKIGCGRRKKVEEGGVVENQGKESTLRRDFEGSAGWKLSNSPWNLQVISRSQGSLTRFMPDEVPGVTSPMVYLGMLFSWFAWHVEDHELHSLNFLHMGAPKTWYAVPGSYASTLEEVVHVHCYGAEVDPLAAFAMLGEKRTLISPEILVSSGIPCCRLVQNPGEFVVTFPRSYHVGFSHGFNCGEAANFATSKWLLVAKEAAARRAVMNYLPMLSHQQLLYLLAVSFIYRVPGAFLSRGRRSRRQDRQKEERELVIKKAFFQDITNEQKLVDILLGKKSTLGAVLWNSEMLPFLNNGDYVPCQESAEPSSSDPSDRDARNHNLEEFVDFKESYSCNIRRVLSDIERCEFSAEGQQTKVDTLVEKTEQKSEDLHHLKSNCPGSYLHKSLPCLDDGGDLPYGLDIDSGALACVSCGILGYPFMSIIQPSNKALETLLSCDAKTANQKYMHIEANGDHLSLISEGLMRNANSGMVAKFDAQQLGNEEGCPTGACQRAKQDCTKAYNSSDNRHTWNLSDRRARPRIFCLKHGIRVEKILQSYGGAYLLIICHSDYLKIKCHALSVEDPDMQFNCEDILMENASKQDLDLISVSIDDEQGEECEDDWTSKVGVNLKHFVKRPMDFSSKDEDFDYYWDGVFPDSLKPCRPALRWRGRKHRTAHKHSRFQQCNKISITMGNLCGDPFENSQIADNHECIPIYPSSNQQDASTNESLDSHKKHEFMLSGRLKEGDENRSLSYCSTFNKVSVNHADAASHLCSSKRGDSCSDLETSSLGKRSFKGEVPMQSGPCNDNAKQVEVDANETCGSGNIHESMMEEHNQLSNISAMKCSLICQNNQSSVVSSNKMVCNHSDLFSTKASRGHESDACCNGRSEPDMSMANDTSISGIHSCQKLHQVQHQNHPLNLDDAPSEKVSTKEGTPCDVMNIIVHSKATSCEISETSSMVNSMGTKLETKHLPVFSFAVRCYERKKKKATDIVSQTQCCTHDEDFGIMNGDGHLNIDQAFPHTKQKTKRKRELDKLLCSPYSFGTFVRSPCEGLRSRRHSSLPEINQNTRQSSIGTKKNFKNHGVARKKCSHGVHKCVVEGCHMKFDTKADLAIHRSNRCTFQGCGKQFLNHRNTIRHQRVHVKERPLRCNWEGCSMAFKWDWARTEHFRLHTGERPYTCHVPGCGKTFRFVSDFSKHRRKTGHVGNST